MGMFDYVDPGVEIGCPSCGNTDHEFQSKDGPCDLKTISTAHINNFYTYCSKCGHWMSFDRKVYNRQSDFHNFEIQEY